MNVAILLSRAAQANGEKLAVVQGNKHLCYQELNLRAGKIAYALKKLGVNRGDRVALIQHNAPPFLETLFGLFKLGAVAVPINWRLHPREITFILEQSGTKVVVQDESFPSWVSGCHDQLQIEHWIQIGGETQPHFINYEDLLAQTPEPLPDEELEDNSLAWLFYTSGTTGKPKGAMLSHRNLMSMTMNFFADHYVPDEADIAFHAAPLSHGSGLYSLPMVGRGVTNVLHDSIGFKPGLVLEELHHWRVTIIPFLAPTQVKRLVEEAAVNPQDTSHLKAIIWGGAPMYVDDAHKAVKQFGPILTQLYGLGESPMTITALGKKEMAAELQKHPSLLTAGRPRTDVEVKIIDNLDKVVPDGSIGEVIVRGSVVMKGYWDNPDATAETMRNGWLHTGDIGYIDKRGFLFLVDRKNDMIISGGSNIYPREVEEVLLEHPQVAEVSVFGIPDQQWGESVKAAVRPVDLNTPPSSGELIAFCQDRIASYKKPKSVVFVAKIPKNAYGKILRRELQKKFQ